MPDLRRMSSFLPTPLRERYNRDERKASRDHVRYPIMPRRRMPNPRVLALALRRRLRRWAGRERDAFCDSPPGLALSPSARHFADYAAAPLALRFAGGRWPDVSEWQNQTRAKLTELCGYQRAETLPVAVHPEAFGVGDGLERRRLYLRARPGV